MTAIDLYCERTGPGLWAEPANVLSNLAFVLAAWAIWRWRRDPRVAGSVARVLASLTLAIAIGSTLFHVFATSGTRPLDEGPIVLFQLAFLWRYGRSVLRWRAGGVVAILAGLLVTSYRARQLAHGLNGSLPYAPALLLTAALGIAHARANRRDRWAMLAAAAVFVVAVFFRSIDNAVCPSFPTGTHVVWHLLAAAVLYLCARGLLMNVPPAAGSAAAS